MQDEQPLSVLLESWASTAPDKVFLRLPATELTYAEFNAASNRVAHGLDRAGIGHGDVVGVMLPNSLEFMLTWFGLGKIGAVEAAINTALRGPGLERAVRVAGCRMLVIDDSCLAALEAVSKSLPPLTLIVRGDVEAAASRFPAWRVMPFSSIVVDQAANPGVGLDVSDLAMLLYTSGTTGLSKACMLSHRYALRQGQLLAEQFAVTPHDVLYSPFPLFHVDASLLTVAPALIQGATVALGERFSVSRFWSEVRDFGATVFDFMGATLSLLWKQAPRPDDADNPVRLAWGVPMPSWAAEFEERFGLRLVEVYGLTDAGVVAFQPLDQPRRPGACGRPIAPYDVRIFGEDDRELPPGAIGEIVVRPLEPSLIMDGYHGMPEETLRAFHNLWLHTGDLAFLDEDGWLHFSGREKDVIRRRGENISAYEIEEIVTGHPAVLEAAAFGVPSELTEDDVMVCVVPRPGSAVTPAEIVAYCEPRMARYMLPRYIEFLNQLPTTPTAKVEKYRLREAGVGANTWDRERE